MGCWDPGCICNPERLPCFEASTFRFIFIESLGFVLHLLARRQDVDMLRHFRGCNSTGNTFGLRGERFYPPMATCTFFTLFRFLISRPVPAGSPCLLTETLTSQRSDSWETFVRSH